ncbi:MAG TPA: ferrous iron transporter B [Tepidisphaeraceae bacterium]|jgi:ferrous iron transport protein B|nr:ferrous iron transporter B [Tepidisphaeraceae bacterium]
MSSCCDQSIETPSTTAGTLTVALAGNPNSGKTTLFNALTGLRQKVANYPGVTVEKKTGRCKLPDGRWADVIDLPGTYSLVSRSPDEQVAMEVLRGLRSDTKTPDVVVVVVDASNLQRNLYLVSQLVELGRPLVVALNMMDIASRRGLHVSPENLQKDLGVPVVPVVGYKRKGIAELKAAILQAAIAPLPDWPLPDAMKEELLLVGGGLAILHSEEGENSGRGDAGTRGRGEADCKLQSANCKVQIEGTDPGAIAGTAPQSEISNFKSEIPPASLSASPRPRVPASSSPSLPASSPTLRHFQSVAERLLIGDRAADLRQLAEREPVASLLSAATGRLQLLGIDPMQADVEAHYKWIDQVASRAVTQPGDFPPTTGTLSYASPKPRTLTQRADAILVHKVWGLLIFAGIMAGLFVTLFWAAQPIMDAIQSGIKALGVFTTHRLADGPIKDLLNDGVFAGVGAVVVFVPQIALLFLFLAILEDSGYLARAAFLMDRLLSKVGLHGKSFIPLLSSFACAIPGIMATRTIENRRERLATILVAPFMSCSARLPVYTLLIGAFFSAEALAISHAKAALLQAGIMLACYALGIIAAAGTAWVFKRTLTKGPATSFILELPSYKIPQVSQIARQVFVNTRAFLTKAGTTIFCLSVILWAMAYYPRLPSTRVNAIESQIHTEFARRQAEVDKGNRERYPAFLKANSALSQEELQDKWHWEGEELVWHSPRETLPKTLAAAQSEYSISGRLGHFMEPALRPLGYDWKMGVGLVSAFAAREVFVSSMGIVYSVGEVERGQTQDLSSAMRADHYTSGPRAGKPVWTPLVAVSLLVWFVLAMQCMSTFAVVRRETGGWGWPVFMLVYMNVLAYVVALVVYQVGSHFIA